MLAAIVLDNPLCLAAALAVAAALLAAAAPPRRLYAGVAAVTGVTVFAINPFVSAQGLTVLWQGPRLPVLDTEVTLEELVYGAAAGARLAATILAAAAFVRLVDSDLLLRAVARIAPRSAMIASLATQMLPALERDAFGLTMAARTRAASMRSPRTAAALLPALLSMSLERSLATAESMEARGYGSGRPTRMPERRLLRTEAATAAAGAAAVAVTAAAAVTSGVGMQYYPTLGHPATPGAIVTAAAIAGLAAASAGAARWRR